MTHKRVRTNEVILYAHNARYTMSVINSAQYSMSVINSAQYSMSGIVMNNCLLILIAQQLSSDTSYPSWNVNYAFLMYGFTCSFSSFTCSFSSFTFSFSSFTFSFSSCSLLTHRTLYLYHVYFLLRIVHIISLQGTT